jgi:hypothetical protein
MLRRVVFLSVSLVLLRGPDTYGQSAPNSSKSGDQSAVENLVQMHEAWGPKASTPNTSLLIKESMRSGPVLKFRLIADGVPRDGVYSIVAWPVTQKAPSGVLSGVMLDASGLAICAGKPGTCGSAEKPNDPIDLNLRPAPGEPVRIGLISADGATKVFAKVVPVPLRGEDRGCIVEAILLTPAAELVLIVGSSFPPNAELTMNSESGGERHGGKGKADADGRYSSAILPYKQGVAGGIANVNLKASNCSPSVDVPWGRGN